MPNKPNVRVRDRETGAEYFVSEARFHRTPELWERLGTDPVKPRLTVEEAAARRPVDTTSVRPSEGGEATGHTSGHPADSSEEEI